MKRISKYANLVLALATAVACIAGCENQSSRDSTPAPGAHAPAPTAVVQLTFTYGSEKKAWINDVTTSFNDSGVTTPSGKRVHVNAIPMGSGECIDELLEGRRQAHLTSPASGAFVKLGNAESRAKTGGDLLGPTENLLLSPVVIAMWKPMAQALGWGTQPIGWADILTLVDKPNGWADLGHPEWGRFKFGHTHPEFSNSGLITAFAITYAATGKVAGLTTADVADPHTAMYLGAIETSVQHYGSSTGFFADTLVANGPAYLSAAVLYESSVIESVAHRNTLTFPLVAIYPKEGTFWSDHPVAIVQRDWITADHQEAAKLYIDYLLARPQQEKAVAYGFRPGDPAVGLGPPISAENGVDPREPQTTLEVPSPEVMNAIITLWRQEKKKANLVLVLDTSGSMNEGGKLVGARDGAIELVAMLGDGDDISLLPFSNEMRWAGQKVPLRTGRESIVNTLRSLIAEGGTRLYDSVDAAYQFLTVNPQPDKIAAIIVLTDGVDTDSRVTLPDLLGRIRTDREHRPIRIFTIGYGADAKEDVLRQIADLTQAKYYKGAPENIREVFKDVATFF